MMPPIIPLILCGGSGTRLWPASRGARPKQFLPLLGALSPFQETVARVTEPGLFGRPVVIANVAHRFLIADQLRAMDAEADILLEPEARHSGPAVGAGLAFIASRSGGSALVLSLAADQLIRDAAAFRADCHVACEGAREGHIVAFGVTPTYPATDYGYIEAARDETGAFRSVTRFVEKPDLETAQRFVAEGFLWNSGNLMMRASVLLDDYAFHDPYTVAAVRRAVEAATLDLGFLHLDGAAFGHAMKQSIDHAVMEKTGKAVVLPARFDWSDLGSWKAVHASSTQDEAGNAADGAGLFLNTRNSFISSDGPLVSVVGLNDVAVIATGDAVLVSTRDDPAGLKALVGHLKASGSRLTEDHLQCFRPWGHYRSLEIGQRHQVKRIVVKPGGQLSLQKHHHRSEHWIVIRGAATVTIEDRTEVVHENKSIYIPMGAIHRVENPGKIDLEIIEVQTGSYLGEDDIIRIEDRYNRVPS